MINITAVTLTPQLTNTGETFFIQVTIIHISYWSDLPSKKWADFTSTTWNQLKS